MTREEMLAAAKPIIFCGDMVRAILAGRKTMTRRVIVPQPNRAHTILGCGDDGWSFLCGNRGERGVFLDWEEVRKAQRKTGDILYVRETVWQQGEMRREVDSEPEWWRYDSFRYSATDEPPTDKDIWEKRPSIHMPKAAARIFLRVTNVRAERVASISEADVISEGTPYDKEIYEMPCNIPNTGLAYLRGCFLRLWDSINAKRGYGWDENPWVWVISFERIA